MGRGTPGLGARLGPRGVRILLAHITQQASHPSVPWLGPKTGAPSHYNFSLNSGSVEEGDSSLHSPKTRAWRLGHYLLL